MLRKLLLTLSLTLSLVLPLALPAISFAAPAGDIQRNLCSGVNLRAEGTCSGLEDQTTIDRINAIIKSFIDLLSLIMGVLAVIMVMLGGFKYVISGGSDSNVSSAKNTIVYALVGIIIVAFAQIIVRFVLTRVTTG